MTVADDALLRPIDQLHEHPSISCASQEVLQRLSNNFGAWRPCKSDHNSFFRAVGFAVVESYLLKKPKRLKGVAEIIIKCSDEMGRADSTTKIAKLLVTCSLLDQARALHKLARGIANPELEHQLICAIRIACGVLLTHGMDGARRKAMGTAHGKVLQSVDDILAEGIPSDVSPADMTREIAKATQNLINATVSGEHEVGRAALLIPSIAFGSKIRIISLDGSQPLIPDVFDGEPQATLLFAPGTPNHYSVLYSKDAAKTLLMAMAALESQLDAMDEPKDGSQQSAVDVKAIQKSLIHSVQSTLKVMDKSEVKSEEAANRIREERKEIQIEREDLQHSRIELAEKEALLDEETQLLDELRHKVAAALSAKQLKRPCWACCQNTAKEAANDDASEGWMQPRTEDDQ